MGNKGGQNDGSIYWLDDRQLWCAAVSFGYEGGKRKRKVVYGHTREDVQRKRNALLHDRDQGLPLTDDRITVGQYLDRWLADVVKAAIAARAPMPATTNASTRTLHRSSAASRSQSSPRRMCNAS